MIIEPFDQHRVRVILSPRDLSDLKITYDSMNYKDLNTRRAINAIISEIKQELGINLKGRRLSIEAFKTPGGGCILYITYHQSRSEIIPPLIAKSLKLEDICRLCKRLFDRFSHMILRSELYGGEAFYYLVLYIIPYPDEQLISVVSEYTVICGTGEVRRAVIKEHSSAIINENAVEALAAIN